MSWMKPWRRCVRPEWIPWCLAVPIIRCCCPGFGKACRRSLLGWIPVTPSLAGLPSCWANPGVWRQRKPPERMPVAWCQRHASPGLPPRMLPCSWPKWGFQWRGFASIGPALQQPGQLEHGEEFQSRNSAFMAAVGFEIVTPETGFGELQAFEVVQEIALFVDAVHQPFQ